MYKKILLSISFILTSILLSGCGEEEEISPKQMKSGPEIYNYYCQDCHTRKGPGGLMEKRAASEPMKAYKIILMIKYGYDQGHQMPVFEQLSERQAGAVAQYVYELQLQAIQSRK